MKIDYFGVALVLTTLFAGVSLIINPELSAQSAAILTAVASGYAGNSLPSRYSDKESKKDNEPTGG